MPDRDDWLVRLRSAADVRDAALVELRRFLVRGLMRSFSSRGANEAFVEDVVQEAMLRILDSLDSFAGRSRFTTWAMTIAIRVGTTELRRKRFRDVSLEQITGGENLNIDPVAVPAQPPELQERRTAILQTLKHLVEQTLTEKQRTVVQAYLGGMLPFEEIGRRLGTNRNAVYKMFHDARQKLRRGFEAEGISAADIQAIFG